MFERSSEVGNVHHAAFGSPEIVKSLPELDCELRAAAVQVTAEFFHCCVFRHGRRTPELLGMSKRLRATREQRLQARNVAGSRPVVDVREVAAVELAGFSAAWPSRQRNRAMA